MRTKSGAIVRWRTILLPAMVSLLLAPHVGAQIANGKPKFLGSAAPPSPAANFSTYWN